MKTITLFLTALALLLLASCTGKQPQLKEKPPQASAFMPDAKWISRAIVTTTYKVKLIQATQTRLQQYDSVMLYLMRFGYNPEYLEYDETAIQKTWGLKEWKRWARLQEDLVLAYQEELYRRDEYEQVLRQNELDQDEFGGWYKRDKTFDPDQQYIASNDSLKQRTKQ